MRLIEVNKLIKSDYTVYYDNIILNETMNKEQILKLFGNYKVSEIESEFYTTQVTIKKVQVRHAVITITDLSEEEYLLENLCVELTGHEYFCDKSVDADVVIVEINR